VAELRAAAPPFSLDAEAEATIERALAQTATARSL
jgi:hypothetical protein